MAIPAAVIGAGKLALGLAPLLFGRRGRAKPIDFRAIIERYRALRPTGYLTDADTGFADTQFQRGAEVVGRRVGSARQRAAGRVAARGLSGSPAAERVFEEIDQGESRDLTDMERNRQGLLFGIRRGRESYEQNLNLQGMMGELSGARYNADRDELSRTGFMNSMLEFAPEVFDYFSGLGQGRSSASAGYDPTMTDSPIFPEDPERRG